MHFPVSGVDCPVWLPPATAFVLALVTAPAGLSGAFLLLPLQMSLLGFTSPAVTPTNLLYNTVAIPGGVYRYMRERRMLWPLAWTIIVGTLPGIFAGAIIRTRYLPDARSVKPIIAAVLLYMGIRMLREWFAPAPGRIQAGAKLETTRISFAQVEYKFGEVRHRFSPLAMLALALVVGVVGGIYGVGGGAIIAPFVMTILQLPAYTVAGAAMAGTLAASLAGVACFAWIGVPADWRLGILFGIGGLAGSYCGARLQKHLPERWIRLFVGVLVLGLAVTYLAQFFIKKGT
jgi:uncharacterized membrane protein YfcA